MCEAFWNFIRSQKQFLNWRSHCKQIWDNWFSDPVTKTIPSFTEVQRAHGDWWRTFRAFTVSRNVFICTVFALSWMLFLRQFWWGWFQIKVDWIKGTVGLLALAKECALLCAIPDTACGSSATFRRPTAWYWCTVPAFRDEKELVANATDAMLGQIYFAGIVFVNPFPDPNSLPRKITYKIRPKAEPYNKSSAAVDESKRFSWFTNLMYPSRSRPREPEKTPFGGIPPGNLYSIHIHIYTVSYTHAILYCTCRIPQAVIILVRWSSLPPLMKLCFHRRFLIS